MKCNIYTILSFLCLSFIPSIKGQLCLVDFDCDSSCLNKFGDNVDNELLTIFRKSIYPYRNIDVFKFKLNTIRKHPDLFLGGIKSHNILLNYNNFINTNYYNNNTCLNILLTDTPDSNINGYAYINGVCSYVNVGIVKINVNKKYYPGVLAHEYGHIIGLEHICYTNPTLDNIDKSCDVLKGTECVPSDGNYIMYPSSTKCNKYGNQLSPCSIDFINHNNFNIPCLQSGEPDSELFYEADDCGMSIEDIIIIVVILLIGIMLFLFIMVSLYDCIKKRKTETISNPSVISNVNNSNNSVPNNLQELYDAQLAHDLQYGVNTIPPSFVDNQNFES